MTRALLYLRQSDTDGDGDRSLSLDSQASVLMADARRHEWVVIEEIRDADQKGWDDKRPGLLRLYERCRTGDVDLVAVWSLSRLARSLKIQEHVFDELSALGVDVWSHEEPDVNRPLFRQILGAFNEEQTRVISSHTRRALHERVAQGLMHGTVPFGYIMIDHRWVPDPETASIARWIFESRADGASYGDIVRELAARGVASPRGLPEWHQQSVRKMIHSHAYRGSRHFGGKTIEDNHEAIVSDDLWHRAQRADDIRPRSPRRQHDEYRSWLEGLILHECGRPMYVHARSPHRQSSVRCATLSNNKWRPCGLLPMSLVLAEFERLSWSVLTEDIVRVSQRPLRAVIADARRRYRELSPASEAAAREARERRARALARRQRAEDLYLSGARDRAWFDAEDARTTAEIKETDAILQKLPAPPDHDDIEQRWSEVRNLATALAGVQTPPGRMAVLRGLGVVVFGPSGIRIRYRAEFQELFRGC